ncbi:MAG: hypothetical protein EOO68_13680, partial [Moraxellaceae bacterium]
MKAVENKPINLESMSVDALVNVIQSGSDEQIKAAAIKKISDQSVLLKLAGLTEGNTTTEPPAIQKVARQRIAQLIDEGAINGEQLCQSISDKNALFSLLGFVNNNDLFDQAFASITDETILANYATDGATSKLRQRAAEKISDKKILQQVLKNTKTKDKTVFKIVKEKCDLLKDEEKRNADVLAAVTATVQSLEQHSNRAFDAQFSA